MYTLGLYLPFLHSLCSRFCWTVTDKFHTPYCSRHSVQYCILERPSSSRAASPNILSRFRKYLAYRVCSLPTGPNVTRGRISALHDSDRNLTLTPSWTYTPLGLFGSLLGRSLRDSQRLFLPSVPSGCEAYDTLYSARYLNLGADCHRQIENYPELIL